MRGAAWKSKPTYYILGSEYRPVHPDLKHFLAERLKAKTMVRSSSHVPMLSQLEAVYQVHQRRSRYGPVAVLTTLGLRAVQRRRREVSYSSYDVAS